MIHPICLKFPLKRRDPINLKSLELSALIKLAIGSVEFGFVRP